MAEKCSPTSEQSPFTGDSACDWQFNFVCSCFWRFYKFFSLLLSLIFTSRVTISGGGGGDGAHFHHCPPLYGICTTLYSWNEQRERPWYVTGWHLLCSFWPPLPSVAATAAGSVLSLSLALSLTRFVFHSGAGRWTIVEWWQCESNRLGRPASRLSRFTIHMRTFYLWLFCCWCWCTLGAMALLLLLVYWWHWQWQWQRHQHRLSPPFECIQCWLGAEMWCDEMRCCLQKKERNKMILKSCCAQVAIRQQQQQMRGCTLYF